MKMGKMRSARVESGLIDSPRLRWQRCFTEFGVCMSEAGAMLFLDMVEEVANGREMADVLVDLAEDYGLSLDTAYYLMDWAMSPILAASPAARRPWGLSHLRGGSVFALARRMSKLWSGGCDVWIQFREMDTL